METTVVFETSDSFKADQVEALFKTNAIEYERMSFGAGSHVVRLFGVNNVAGIQIAVRTEDEEKAKNLLYSTGFIT